MRSLQLLVHGRLECLDRACAAVEGVSQPARRMSIMNTSRVVASHRDSYNANLDSFRAGCKAAGDLAAGRQLVVVAGGMLELGEARKYRGAGCTRNRSSGC